MTIFSHHMYEYRKGLRNLVLLTMPGSQRAQVEAKLAAEEIDYVIHGLTGGNINVFFGAEACVAVVRAIGKNRLGDYTPEEDFILGTMLGYSRLQQCVRYIQLRNRQQGRAAEPAGPRTEKPQSRPSALALTH